jgi:GNAT superfamily N-acetyltransferase
MFSQANRAAEILADSFLHYPLMRYAFEESPEEKRLKCLNQLYHECCRAAAMFGGVLITPDQKGALIWLPGNNFPLSLHHEIKSGMWKIPIEVGIKATLRLMNHDTVSENWIKKNANKNFGYIWCVGVNAASRGKGYSRILIDECIQQMRHQGITEFWLKTEDPKNVLIYKKLGFELMHETVVKSSGITSWVMRKK